MNRFAFLNLVSFDLSLAAFDQFRALQLLEFLKASPVPRAVRMEIIRRVSLDNIHRNGVVVLPDAENFLVLSNGSRTWEDVDATSSNRADGCGDGHHISVARGPTDLL